MRHQEVARCEHDPAAFAAVDTGRGAAVRAAASGPDLDDNERIAVATDEIELAATAAIAAGKHSQAVHGEPVGRELLEYRPARLGR